MIAPDPAQRFSSYDQLIAELEQAQRAPGTAGDGRVAHGRARWWFFVTGALLMAVMAAAAIFFLIRKPPEKASARTSAKSSAQAVRTMAKEQSQARSVVNATGAEHERKARDLEAASWNAALSRYKEQVALYNFADAAEAIKTMRLTDALLKRAKETTEKKAQWLVDWKDDLMKDLNDTHFSGALADRSGEQYTGIAGATDKSLSLKLPYGIARVTWAELSPQALLSVSTSFIQPTAPDAADRQWRCAVFASETGQVEAARRLAEAAAKTNPQYRDQVSILFSNVSQH